MKIELDIQKEYEKLVVSIKNNMVNDEVNGIIKKLESNNDIKIIGKKDESIYRLATEDIVCFYSEGSKVKAETMKDKFDIKEKLYVLEELLKHKGFVRLSKFSIGNVNKIKRIDVEFNGSMVIVFKNDRSEIISRRQVKYVKDYLGIGGKK